MPIPTSDEEIKEKPLLKPVNNPVAYADELKERKASFTINLTFKPGDLIIWKRGMKNKTIPDKDVPGIVINNFFPPLTDEDRDISSTYFNDVLDIQVGFISDDGEFIVFAHDSRRFQLYKY